jgi:hypothetical protein
MTSPTSTSSSLSSSERFGLQEADHSQIVVYHHKRGVYLSSQHELCQKLNKGKPTPQTPPTTPYPALALTHTLTTKTKTTSLTNLSTDPTLRVSKKPIPWGNSHVEVHQGDLFPEPERKKYKDWPNMHASLAAIRLPPAVHWKRMLGRFREMYIVSPDSSPATSPEDSPESSKHVSPNCTFEQDHGVTAAGGVGGSALPGNP